MKHTPNSYFGYSYSYQVNIIKRREGDGGGWREGGGRERGRGSEGGREGGRDGGREGGKEEGTEGLTEGRTDGRTDGRKGGRKDRDLRRIHKLIYSITKHTKTFALLNARHLNVI